MNSEDTLRKNDDGTNKILEAISGLRQDLLQDLRQQINYLRQDVNQQINDLRQDVNQQINDLRQDVNQQINDLRQDMNERLAKIEGDLQIMKHLQLSFDVRFDRLEAVVLNVRADVKILRAEVEAWSKDVNSLQKNFELNLK